MNGFFYDSRLLLFHGFLLGLAFGVIYDIFRLIRISLSTGNIAYKSRFFKLISPKKPIFKQYKPLKRAGEKLYFISVFIEDVLFFIICSLFTVLFFLGENDGEIRAIVIIFSALGFAAYILTVGKLTFLFSKHIIFFARCLLYWFFYVILLPIRIVVHTAERLLVFLYKISIKRISDSHKRKISSKIQEDIVRCAAAGFEMFKETENE